MLPTTIFRIAVITNRFIVRALKSMYRFDVLKSTSSRLIPPWSYFWESSCAKSYNEIREAIADLSMSRAPSRIIRFASNQILKSALAVESASLKLPPPESGFRLM